MPDPMPSVSKPAGPGDRFPAMFLAHYGVALAAKRVAPRVSLGTAFAAAQLADLVWPVLLLAGAERVRLTPSDNPFLRLDFEWYPWTHSLLMALVWGALAGAAYAAVRHDRESALVVGLLVVSHWMLDLVVHVPDLPLYPGGPEVGFGLWRSVAGTLVIEGVIFVAGLAVYSRVTRPIDRTGRLAFWAVAVLIVLVYAASALGPPPPDANTVAWGALAGWLLPLFGWWVDRHRRSTLPNASTDVAHGA